MQILKLIPTASTEKWHHMGCGLFSYRLNRNSIYSLRYSSWCLEKQMKRCVYELMGVESVCPSCSALLCWLVSLLLPFNPLQILNLTKIVISIKPELHLMKPLRFHSSIHSHILFCPFIKHYLVYLFQTRTEYVDEHCENVNIQYLQIDLIGSQRSAAEEM